MQRPGDHRDPLQIPRITLWTPRRQLQPLNHLQIRTDRLTVGPLSLSHPRTIPLSPEALSTRSPLSVTSARHSATEPLRLHRSLHPSSPGRLSSRSRRLPTDPRLRHARRIISRRLRRPPTPLLRRIPSYNWHNSLTQSTHTRPAPRHTPDQASTRTPTTHRHNPQPKNSGHPPHPTRPYPYNYGLDHPPTHAILHPMAALRAPRARRRHFRGVTNPEPEGLQAQGLGDPKRPAPHPPPTPTPSTTPRALAGPPETVQGLRGGAPHPARHRALT